MGILTTYKKSYLRRQKQNWLDEPKSRGKMQCFAKRFCFPIRAEVLYIFSDRISFKK